MCCPLPGPPQRSHAGPLTSSRPQGRHYLGTGPEMCPSPALRARLLGWRVSALPPFSHFLSGESHKTPQFTTQPVVAYGVSAVLSNHRHVQSPPRPAQPLPAPAPPCHFLSGSDDTRDLLWVGPAACPDGLLYPASMSARPTLWSQVAELCSSLWLSSSPRVDGLHQPPACVSSSGCCSAAVVAVRPPAVCEGSLPPSSSVSGLVWATEAALTTPPGRGRGAF